MMKSNNVICKLICFIPLLLLGCGGGSSNTEPNDNSAAPSLAEIESDIISTLDAYETDLDFTFFIQSANGNSLVHSTGGSSEFVTYESASTSKLVTAVIILSLVDDNVLSLDDHPQDYISSWPTTGNLADITLSQLLSFTSGLSNEPLCLHGASQNFENCIDNIATQNSDSPSPGSEYYYSSAHLQVAGLMAIKASGYSSWESLFTGFQADTSLFLNSSYDLPSTSNPRLAGGMHWIADDYVQFLAALYNNSIVPAELLTQLSSDQISSATISNSPALDTLNEDWHYGYGAWIECEENPYNCDQTNRISSPGAYGAYPFIDFEHGYYGIIARQGELGTLETGIEIFRAVQQHTEDWAAK
jgi:hypothetical protein